MSGIISDVQVLPMYVLPSQTINPMSATRAKLRDRSAAVASDNSTLLNFTSPCTSSCSHFTPGVDGEDKAGGTAG